MSSNILRPKLGGVKFIFFTLFLVLFLQNTNRQKFILASDSSDLKLKISEKNKEIEEIEKEVANYKKILRETSKETTDLKSELFAIENSLAKIKAEVKFSQKKIESSELSIEELTLAISKTEEQIKNSKKTVSESLRLLDQAYSNSFIEIILANKSLSQFFDNLNNIENFEEKTAFNLGELKILKKALQLEKDGADTEKTALIQKKEELLDRQNIQKEEELKKASLLKETKNKESAYREILNEKIKKQKEIEKEIEKIEQELKISIDPSSLPKPEKGVLAWPLSEQVITQYFGNTPFATKNSQVYGGMGHNGIDLRASVGTEITASEKGRVIGTGNTDAACKGVSYGKWILIEHPNNLSTLYSHLSLIKAKENDIIKKGQVIGYSGDTGYITGPHLHFAVFAAKAVKVSTMQSKVCGTIMKLPIAPYNGYLNPLSYL